MSRSARLPVMSALLLLVVAAAAEAEPEPRGFTEDPFETEEKFREKVTTTEVTGVLGGEAKLPCDLTAPFPTDSPHLILFYKDTMGSPVYVYDLRQSEGTGRHWRHNETLGPRAYLNRYETGMVSETGAPVIHSYLRVQPLRKEDAGVFRCRVDFQEAPTRNTRIALNLIVPPEPPIIRSESGAILFEYSEPVREGSEANLVCETVGGDPLPRVSWWRGKKILDDVVEEVDAKAHVVRNTLRLTNLKRSDHGARLTCKAFNTNLTRPVETGVKIDMVFPPVRAKIVREWKYFTVGKAYNVSCQVLGSRPPATTTIYVGTSQLREVTYRLSSDGNVSTTTVIFIPTESDQGKFLTCRALNINLPGSAVEDQWKIEVHYPPSVSLHMTSSGSAANDAPSVLSRDGGEHQTEPVHQQHQQHQQQQRQSVREGNSIYLHCMVDANPMAKDVTWFYESVAIEPSRADVNMVVKKETLSINQIQAHQRGKYHCLAQNALGQEESNVINLDVRYHSDIPKSLFSEHGGKSILTYTAQTRLDFGQISCLASNAVGESEAGKACVFFILPAGKPEGLQNCTTVNQTYESLTITCQPGFSGGAEQSFILEVFKTASHSMVLNITTNKPTFYIRGLSAGTEYSVEIYAANDKGRSEKFPFETFTLQPAEKQLAATTTDLASNSSSMLRLFPIIGVLLAIVLLLVLLAVIVVIVLRGRSLHSSSSSGLHSHVVSSASVSSLGGSAGGVSGVGGSMTGLGVTKTHVSFNSLEEEMMLIAGANPDAPQQQQQQPGSPDVIPANVKGGTNYASSQQQQQQQYYDVRYNPDCNSCHVEYNGEHRQLLAQQQKAPRSASNSLQRRGDSHSKQQLDNYLYQASSSREQQPTQYIKLAFQRPPGTAPKPAGSGGSVVGISNTLPHNHGLASGRLQQHTSHRRASGSVTSTVTYATIDHNHRRAAAATNLKHSANCPHKTSHSSSSSSSLCRSSQRQVIQAPSLNSSTGETPANSGTLKKVAFKEEPMVAPRTPSASSASTQSPERIKTSLKRPSLTSSSSIPLALPSALGIVTSTDIMIPPPASVSSSSGSFSSSETVVLAAPPPPPGYESEVVPAEQAKDKATNGGAVKDVESTL